MDGLVKSLSLEPVSKRFSLFKAKEGENFNHRNTLLFRGLKFEINAEIGQISATSKWDVLKLAHLSG